VLETIKSGTEISYLFVHGRRFSAPFITLIVKKRNLQHDQSGRVAFIAGKKLGNAVWRNRAKRRMRAVCKEAGGPWRDYDVIFIAKSQTNEVSYSKVLSTCNALLAEVFDEASSQ
jgi:ribonuclease P protein component